MATKRLPRKFKYEGTLLEDPDPTATPEEVMASYAEIYDDLVNAVVDGPDMTDDAILYTFNANVGTKS